MPSSRPRRKSSRIKVRPASPADLDALMELERRVFDTDQLSRQSMRRLVNRPSARVIVAEMEHQLAGAAIVLFRRRSTVARLYSIAVAPHLGGRGVGPALLAMVDKVAMARRCRCVRLEVRVDNKAAIDRYCKSGYRQRGRRTGYYEDGADALLFEKPIGRPRKARVVRPP
jgi:ribosomal protein S18 acetylase RimI-like enzyme